MTNLGNLSPRKIVREIGWGCMERIHLAQDSDQWRFLVNLVMNLLVQYNFGHYLSG
jgi:hypothetical protein